MLITGLELHPIAIADPPLRSSYGLHAPFALRTIVDAVGGMTALADKTGLSRETLYRTLSERGNPRLDTLAVILAAFGLRLTVQPAQKSRARRSEPRPALA